MKVLFICTHNRCRSILSEAITNSVSKGVIKAKSAGSSPVGEVHPLSLKYLAQCDYPIEGLKSQSWDEFEDFFPDLVITVCDAAAGETCPLYFTKSLKVHWPLSDPSKLEGNDKDIEDAFLASIALIAERANALSELALQGLERDSLKAALHRLGAR